MLQHGEEEGNLHGNPRAKSTKTRENKTREKLRVVVLMVVCQLIAVLISGCATTASYPAATSTAVVPTPPGTATPVTIHVNNDSGTINFTTDDGVTLSAKPYGHGTTAVVLSAEDDVPGSAWKSFAQELANRGYLALTYDYRGIGDSQGIFDTAALTHDLTAAIGAAKALGATKIVLMGAVFGGLLTAKVAVTAHPEAIVMLTTLLSHGGIALSASDLQALTAPKLLAVSQQDLYFIHPMHELCDSTPQPKELLVYPGTVSGVDFLNDPTTQADFRSHLFTFLQTYAPAT